MKNKLSLPPLLLFMLIFIAASVGVFIGFTIRSKSTVVTAVLPNNSISQNNAATVEIQSPPSTTSHSVDLESYNSEEATNIRVYEERNKSVVNITTETLSYNWFLEPVPTEGSSGSGVIIDSRGYVLTNNHVIRNAVKVMITLWDGTSYEGTLVGHDTENDIAVVQFTPVGKKLAVLPLGNSSNLRIGQKVFAIGNPFALDRTLTVGIISALGRPVRTQNNLVIPNMIQTDASINPGNSGGPLLDSRGSLIGINTVIYSPSGGSVGIGFAVPVNTAKRVVSELIAYGQVRRGWIEIIPRQIFPELVQYARLPINKGLLISEITRNGNAEKSGLLGGSKNSAVRYGRTIIYLGGDIITKVDDYPVSTISNLYEALEDNKPGERIAIEYYRKGKQKTTTITLSERPDRFQWD